jgi:2,4-dienoyl-CoA reductase-like NADH-dependent reductase (Old Yellow Enzyme family)
MLLRSPLRLRSGLVLENRVVKASMSEGLADGAGTPDARLERLYGRWAQGGVGLQLTGNVMVDARWLERPRNVVVEDGRAAAALSRWASAGRVGGAKMIAQISHPGRQTNRFVSSSPLAPSDGPAVRLMGSFAPPRAMTGAEVLEAIQRFARTAALLERAGFDGVELHAAHGYLISQFLSPLTNRRDDAWGGDAAGRMRFLLEVLAAVRAATGPTFTVGVKLNSADFQRGGFGEDDALLVVRALDQAGIDFLEISGGNYESPALFGVGVGSSTARREAYFLDFARRVRQVSSVPLLVTGGFRSAAAMEEALASGACDLVGLARPLALDPDLPARLVAEPGARATTRGPRVPRAFVALADAAFYAAQLARMGDGLDPSARINPWVAMLRYVVGDMFRASAWKRRLIASPPALARGAAG